jgi:hypothetical protein
LLQALNQLNFNSSSAVYEKLFLKLPEFDLNPPFCYAAIRLAHTENLAQSLATKDPEIRIACMIMELSDKYGKRHFHH